MNAIIANNSTIVILKINTAPVFVDCNMFTVLDFDGLNITGPICHLHTGTALGVVGASATTEVTPLTPAQVITTAAVTANADNQAFIA